MFDYFPEWHTDLPFPASLIQMDEMNENGKIFDR